MILDENVVVKCSGHNKRQIKALEKNLDIKWEYHKEIVLPLEYVPINCSSPVNIQCDYCLEEGIINVFPREYSKCIRSRKKTKKDCCEKHSNVKAKESREKTYNDNYRNKGLKRDHKGSTAVDEIENKLDILGLNLVIEEYNGDNSRIPYKCKLYSEMKTQYVRIDRLNEKCVCRYCNYCEIQNRYKHGRKKTLPNDQRTLDGYLRNSLTLWKKTSLNEYGGKCIITGESKDIRVHHLISFNEIVNDVLKELKLDKKEYCGDYTDEELYLITIGVYKYHNRNPLGVPITKSIHDKFHSIYGYKSGVNIKNFLAFIRNEYNVILKSEDLKKREIKFNYNEILHYLQNNESSEIYYEDEQDYYEDLEYIKKFMDRKK